MPEPRPSFDVGAFAYAHRGLWDAARPENSIAAFEAAARAGVGCELDVRTTRDGRAVVFHDAALQRLCGRPERVDALSLGEIRALRLPDGSAIPTLDEALEAMAGQPTLVEIKIDDPADQRATDAAVAVLRASRAPAGVMSFDRVTVLRLAAEGLERPVGMLLNPNDAAAAVETARRALAGGCAYLAPHVSVLGAAVEAFPETPRVTWTIRTEAELRATRAAGAAPIFEGSAAGLALGVGKAALKSDIPLG